MVWSISSCSCAAHVSLIEGRHSTEEREALINDRKQVHEPTEVTKEKEAVRNQVDDEESTMTPEQAHRAGIPLGIMVDEQNWRVMAEVFDLPDGGGIVFADQGWQDSFGSFHPFHRVEGDVVESGDDWIIGEAVIFRIEPRGWLWDEYQVWREFRESDEGKRYTTDLARTVMKRDGML